MSISTSLQTHPKTVAVLGSTGSIGTQTLEVLAQYPQQFRVVALAAGKNADLLAQQVAQFQPQWASLTTPQAADALKQSGLAQLPTVLHGPEALCALATLPEVDTVVIGLVGIAGLAPTLAALKAGKRVLTANKETLVAAGHLVQPYLSQLIPFDSEHSALFQCLGGHLEKDSRRNEVQTLWLTASGGPFRTWSQAQIEKATLKEALKHPNWQMGAKVTVDSATLMNKGLELIEAHWLFGLPYGQMQVVIHPQSVLHSAVEFIDGSIIGQMGTPDMRVPIQYALSYPARLDGSYLNSRLCLTDLANLSFEAPDRQRFACLALAEEAAKQGPAATAVLNAADEAVVEAFLQERIGFNQIPKVIEQVLNRLNHSGQELPSLNQVIELDEWARTAVAEQLIPLAAGVRG